MSSRIGLKIALLFMAIIPIESGLVLQPALGEIAKSFPNTSPTIIGYISTIPSLGMIIMALIAGRLSVTMNKKKLLMTGLILSLIGGVAPVLYPELWFILACRTLLGLGNGIILPLVQGLIAEFFEGNERASMMGYSIAVASVGGMIMSPLAGFVAMVGWRWNFLLYLFIGVIMVIGWFNLPDLPTGKRVGESGQKVPAVKGIWTFGVLFMCILGLLYSTLSMTANVAMPLFVASENIGNPGQIGMAMALLMLCSFFSSLAFGRIQKRIGLYFLPVGCALFVVAFLNIAFAYRFSPIFVSWALVGFAAGLLAPGYNFSIASIVPRTHQSFALGVMNSLMAVGVFAAAPAMGLILSIVGSQSYRALFNVVAGIFAVMVIIFAIYVAATKGRVKTDVLDAEGLPPTLPPLS